jgi:CRP/FNR family nitrogen fixation transcriptional regulator
MPGETFGFEAAADHHFFADAVTSVGLKTLRLSSDADLSRELLTLTLRSLGRAHDHLLTLGRTDALGRVAAFLLEMADRQDVRGHSAVDLPMSRTDIADYLGLTIETVSRAMTKLKTERIIRLVSTRQIEVLRWEALEYLTG